MKKNKMKEITDMPLNYFTGEPHVELLGNSECVVDGLQGIVEYSPEKIKINLGTQMITFFGDDLHINSFTQKGAVVEGYIISMEFSS